MSYPRVMVDIVKEMVLYGEDTWFLKSRYLRRGRLVEAAATNLARGIGIDEAWWSRGSGQPGDPDDYIAHEECRPAINGALRFLADTGARLVEAGLEVINPVERYLGHLDWLLCYADKPDTLWIVDLKHGRPPAEYLSVGDLRRRNPLYDAYRMQTALYLMALAASKYLIARRAGLHLYDGTYQLVVHDNPRDCSRALIAVRGWHLRNDYRRSA